MNVDRTRFLLLAAALSANACTIIDNRGQTDAAAVPEEDTAVVTDDAAVDDAASDTAKADSTPADAGADAACTEEGVTVPACTGTTTGGCALDTMLECTQVTDNFKPGAAKRAIDCISALPTCEGTTTADPVWDCAMAALEGGCPDPTVDDFCTNLALSCAVDAGADAGPTVDILAQCKRYAGGLDAAGRTSLQGLVTAEGGCTTPLRDTMRGL